MTTPTTLSATVTSVNDSATSVAILAANSARRWFSIFNNSTSYLYIRAGAAAASLTDFSFRIDPYDYYEHPQPAPGAPPYVGAWTGIWSADSSGAALVTDYAAQ